MINLQKVLPKLIIPLMLVVIIEGIYLFFIQDKIGGSIPEKQSLSNIVAPAAIKSSIEVENQAINKDVLARWYTTLRWYKKGVLKSSNLINKYEGVISRIDKKGRTFEGGGSEYDGIKYAKSFVLKGDNGDENWFFFRDGDGNTKRVYKKVLILKTVKGKEVEIDFDELQLGDKLEVTQTLILTNEFQTSSLGYRIIKL